MHWKSSLCTSLCTTLSATALVKPNSCFSSQDQVCVELLTAAFPQLVPDPLRLCQDVILLYLAKQTSNAPPLTCSYLSLACPASRTTCQPLLALEGKCLRPNTLAVHDYHVYGTAPGPRRCPWSPPLSHSRTPGPHTSAVCPSYRPRHVESLFLQ